MHAYPVTVSSVHILYLILSDPVLRNQAVAHLDGAVEAQYVRDMSMIFFPSEALSY